MKICQIMAGNEEGGLEKHLVELSNGLLEYVADVVVVAHEKYRSRFLPQIKFISLDLSHSRRNPLILFQLARIIRNENPDIVHAQANKAVDMLARIKHFIPGIRIGTLHSKKKNIAMYYGMNTVIGVSKGVLSDLRHPDSRVVYNGIPFNKKESYNRETIVEKFNLTSKSPITLSVGRLVPVKAFDNLINAWRPDLGQLLIIGDGPEKTNLEQLIKKRNLTEVITLTGFRDDVREIMPAADLLVVSSHREGFSYAVAEALLARVPVLSTRVPVANELLSNNFLVEINNVTALFDALWYVLSHLTETQSLQHSVFDWAKDNLTTKKMVTSTVEIYQDLLNRDNRE